MATKNRRTSPDPKQTGWPASVPYIIGNEGCERFSFYGMRAILYVYLVGLYINFLNLAPGQAERDATQTYHLFVAAVYAFPIIGAILADRVLGKYRTIFWLSLVYCAGHACLALFESEGLQRSLFNRVFITPVQGMYLGLILIGVGSGGIKPCVSANVGDQFGPGNWHLLQKVFNAFYFIINFGSAFATLLIPRIRGSRQVEFKVAPETIDSGLASQGDAWAYSLPEVTMEVSYSGSVSWAFAVPGILMGLATIFFWAGRNKYVHVPPSQPGKIGWLDLAAGSALFSVIAVPIWGFEFIEPMMRPEGEEHARHLLVWLVICAISLLFFVLFLFLFLWRQRIKQDDGFLAVLVFCALRVVSGGSSKDDFDAAAGKPTEEDKRKQQADSQDSSEPDPDTEFKDTEDKDTEDKDAEDKDAEDKDATPEEADETNAWLLDHWFFKHGVRRFGLAATEGPAAVLKIMCIFSFVSLFWALFDQHSSTWIKQAEQMDRSIEFSNWQFILGGLFLGLVVGGAFFLTFYSNEKRRKIAYGTLGGSVIAGLFGGIGMIYLVKDGGMNQLEASQIPAANPFMVMILIPYCNFGLYPLMARFGMEPTPLRRMTIGMMMTGLSFVAVALIQIALNAGSENASDGDSGGAVHVLWQMIPYLILTTSEVMVSITGLEFAYSQAPKKMKSVIMGFWLMTVTVGNVIVSLTASFFKELDLLPFFTLFAIAMFVSAFAFGLFTMVYKYKDYTQ